MKALFPELITRLPEADIPLPGLTAFLAQAGNQQFVFMTFAEAVDVPEHTHEAQWGVILDGEIELTIAGVQHLLKRGDSYTIPAGVKHSARIKPGYKDLVCFDQKDMYSRKRENQPDINR